MVCFQITRSESYSTLDDAILTEKLREKRETTVVCTFFYFFFCLCLTAQEKLHEKRETLWYLSFFSLYLLWYIYCGVCETSVSIRQHTSAYVVYVSFSLSLTTGGMCIATHASAYVSIRQYVSLSLSQHTSVAHVSIRHDASLSLSLSLF